MARSLGVSIDEGAFWLVALDSSLKTTVVRAHDSILTVDGDVVVVYADELDGEASVSVTSFDTLAEPDRIAEAGFGTAAVLRVRCSTPLIVSSMFDGPPADAQVAEPGAWIVTVWRTAPRAFTIGLWQDNPTLLLPPVEGLVSDRDAEAENERQYEAATGPLRRLVASGTFEPGERRLTLRSRTHAPAERVIQLWTEDTWMEDWNNPGMYDGDEYIVASLLDTKPTLATYLRTLRRSSTAATLELRWAICLPSDGEEISPDEHVTAPTTLTIDVTPHGSASEYTLTHNGLPQNALDAARVFWDYRMAKCNTLVRQPS